jgi:hypothetical protein
MMLRKGNIRISEVKVIAFNQYYSLQKQKGQIHNTGCCTHKRQVCCSLQQEKYSGVFE